MALAAIETYYGERIAEVVIEICAKGNTDEPMRIFCGSCLELISDPSIAQAPKEFDAWNLDGCEPAKAKAGLNRLVSNGSYCSSLIAPNKRQGLAKAVRCNSR